MQSKWPLLLILNGLSFTCIFALDGGNVTRCNLTAAITMYSQGIAVKTDAAVRVEYQLQGSNGFEEARARITVPTSPITTDSCDADGTAAKLGVVFMNCTINNYTRAGVVQVNAFVSSAGKPIASCNGSWEVTSILKAGKVRPKWSATSPTSITLNFADPASHFTSDFPFIQYAKIIHNVTIRKSGNIENPSISPWSSMGHWKNRYTNPVNLTSCTRYNLSISSYIEGSSYEPTVETTSLVMNYSSSSPTVRFVRFGSCDEPHVTNETINISYVCLYVDECTTGVELKIQPAMNLGLPAVNSKAPVRKGTVLFENLPLQESTMYQFFLSAKSDLHTNHPLRPTEVVVSTHRSPVEFRSLAAAALSDNVMEYDVLLEFSEVYRKGLYNNPFKYEIVIDCAFRLDSSIFSMRPCSIQRNVTSSVIDGIYHVNFRVNLSDYQIESSAAQVSDVSFKKADLFGAQLRTFEDSGANLLIGGDSEGNFISGLQWVMHTYQPRPKAASDYDLKKPKISYENGAFKINWKNAACEGYLVKKYILSYSIGVHSGWITSINDYVQKGNLTIYRKDLAECSYSELVNEANDSAILVKLKAIGIHGESSEVESTFNDSGLVPHNLVAIIVVAIIVVGILLLLALCVVMQRKREKALERNVPMGFNLLPGGDYRADNDTSEVFDVTLPVYGD